MASTLFYVVLLISELGLFISNIAITLYCQMTNCNYECSVNYPTLINCNTNHFFNLRKEFQRISKIQRKGDKDFTDFTELLLSNAPIDILHENTFSNITIKQISIHDTNRLTFIHKNALSGPTINVTKKIYLSGTNKLRNSPPNYDLFYAFSSLPNLESITICLESQSYHEIPENAFYRPDVRQNYLKEIVFKGDFSINNINNNSFYGLADNKISLTFDYISIDYISSGAFDLKSVSDQVMDIHLQNCSLTELSFGNAVFSGSQRPLIIDLKGNQIRFIHAKTFGPFCDLNMGLIDFESNPFDCSDYYKYEWLLIRKNQLKDRIRNAFCDNGLSIWDLTEPNSANSFNSIFTLFLTISALFMSLTFTNY